MYGRIIKIDKHSTDFKTIRDYEIYVIKLFGPCGVAGWYKNLDNLDDDTLRILFVLLMDNNRKNKELNRNYGYIKELEEKIDMLRDTIKTLEEE